MISGRRSQYHLALASVWDTLCSGRLKETELYLKSNETACIVNRTELDICITQRGIYRMLIIMLIMRQMDLYSVYM